MIFWKWMHTTAGYYCRICNAIWQFGPLIRCYCKNTTCHTLWSNTYIHYISCGCSFKPWWCNKHGVWVLTTEQIPATAQLRYIIYVPYYKNRTDLRWTSVDDIGHYCKFIGHKLYKCRLDCLVVVPLQDKTNLVDIKFLIHIYLRAVQ